MDVAGAMSQAVDAVEALTHAIDALVAEDPHTLGDAESIKALHRQLSRLEAQVTRATAAFDASKDWMLDKARGAAPWLAWQTGLPKSTAQRMVRAGRELRGAPEVEQAWLEGSIAAARARRILRARNPRTAERFAAEEATLVGFAERREHYWQFEQDIRTWEINADPDGEDDKAIKQHAARNVWLVQSFQDAWLGEINLDPISGAIVDREFRRIQRELFEADWKQAEAELGREPAAGELARTTAQRRADALVEMAIRSATAGANGRRPEPLFTALVGYPTLAEGVVRLANNTVLAPGALLPWLTEAWVERVVFDSPSRVIDVGVARRLFTGATRRAVEVREQTCFDPTCDTPSAECQVDHVHPWSRGGPTVQANGQPACPFHNRDKGNSTAAGPDP